VKDKELIERIQHRFTRMIPEIKDLPYDKRLQQSFFSKIRVLRVYCLELALADFGRDLRRSESGRANRNFVFFVT